MMTMVSPQATLDAIRSQGGRFFRVTFIRRTNGKNGERAGDVRRMLCRLYVRRHVGGVLAPGERAIQDAMHGVLTVWDVEVFWREFRAARAEGMDRIAAHAKAGKAAYRRIPLDSVTELPQRAHGSEIPTA